MKTFYTACTIYAHALHRKHTQHAHQFTVTTLPPIENQLQNQQLFLNYSAIYIFLEEPNEVKMYVYAFMVFRKNVYLVTYIV